MFSLPGHQNILSILLKKIDFRQVKCTYLGYIAELYNDTTHDRLQ